MYIRIILLALFLTVPAFLGFQMKFLAISAMILAILTLSWFYMEKETGFVSLGHSIPFGLSAYLTALNPYLIPICSLTLIPFLLLGKTIFPFATFVASIFTWHFSHYIIIDGGGEEGFRVEVFDPSYLYITSATSFIIFSALFYLASKSNFGLKVKAVRDDEIAAKALGINPWPMKIIPTITSGLISSFAGFLHAKLFGHVSPDIFSPFFSVFPLIAIVVGRDPLIGSYLIVMSSWFLSPYIPDFHYLVYALILIILPYVRGNRGF